MNATLHLNSGSVLHVAEVLDDDFQAFSQVFGSILIVHIVWSTYQPSSIGAKSLRNVQSEVWTEVFKVVIIGELAVSIVRRGCIHHRRCSCPVRRQSHRSAELMFDINMRQLPSSEQRCG